MERKVNELSTEIKNGSLVRNVEELQNNVDAESLKNYFFNGDLLKWCKVNNLNTEADKLDELSNEVTRKICDIFDIEYKEDIQLSGSCDSTNYEETLHVDKATNNIDKEFYDYAKDKITFSKYEIDFIPFGFLSRLSGNIEIRIHNILTELKLSCIVPYSNFDNNQKNNSADFFDRVLLIIKETDKISEYCSCCTSCSGGYGYGLELI